MTSSAVFFSSLSMVFGLGRGRGGCLPSVAPDDPASGDAPFLGLLNPHSGNLMGATFMQEASQNPQFKHRLFDIISVATKAEVMAAFRKQLQAVRAEADATSAFLGREVRPRIVIGGGDGTASFAIWCIFRALQAGGSLWDHEELERYFPAFVQMPLGTGNDFAGVLGWGRSIDPVGHAASASAWLKSAVSLERSVVPFDVWGLGPAGGQCVKVCMLKGLDSMHPDRPQFKVAGPAVPFLSLLYFSMGYEAFVAAQVENNRTESRFANFKEYLKSIPGSLMGAQRRNINLAGVEIRVPEGGDARSRHYFPPPHRESTGAEFTSIGFMNINSFGGGTFKATDPALFADGLMDMFRQKKYIKNILRRGLRFRTEKHASAAFRLPQGLPGVFCQCDGETRYLFGAQGEEVDFLVRRVMQIPVVLGPGAPRESQDACGAETWEDASDVEDGSPASMWACSFSSKGARRRSKKAAHFRFIGADDEKESFRARLDAWVSGALAGEMNATAREVAELQARSDTCARGICRRSQRVHCDFGYSLTTFNACARCDKRVSNHGCRGCRKRLCPRHFLEHLGTTPNVRWMFSDSVSGGIAYYNTFAWSSRLCLDEAVKQMCDLSEIDRPVLLEIIVGDNSGDEEAFDSPQEALKWLRDLRRDDALENVDDEDEKAMISIGSTKRLNSMDNLSDSMSDSDAHSVESLDTYSTTQSMATPQASVPTNGALQQHGRAAFYGAPYYVSPPPPRANVAAPPSSMRSLRSGAFSSVTAKPVLLHRGAMVAAGAPATYGHPLIYQPKLSAARPASVFMPPTHRRP